MSADGSVTLSWADGEHRFRLPIGQLRELQDRCDAGPAAILNRLRTGTWRVDDLREPLRLGLIGGGMEPIKALLLVQRYVEARPLFESVSPATTVLMAALVGVPDDPVGSKKKANRPRRTRAAGSASATSTGSAASSDGAPRT